MGFITDQQTTDELNLLGRYQPGSIYKLFDKTKTKGGACLMEEMLKHPLDNVNKINQRTTIFRYFQKHQYGFPWSAEEISSFSDWRAGDHYKTAVGNFLSTFNKKALAFLVHDENYGRHTRQLFAVSVVIQKLFDFLSNITDYQDVPVLAEKVTAIKKIMSDSRLQDFSRLNQVAKSTDDLSVKKIAAYNHLFRNTLIGEMELVLSFIHELDVYIAVAGVAKLKKFTYANAVGTTAQTKNLLKIKNLKHPGVEGAIGNDLELNDRENLLFLTGANMAGKSTLMKSIGIVLYLSHVGFPIAAAEMSFTVKEGLFSSINVPDNINLGYSHFYAEVLRVKEAAMLVSEGRSLLVMFDELFKGTNVKDAYEGTLEVTKAFSNYHNCIFIISTHIIEVGEALRHLNNVNFAYMPTVLKDGRPLYPRTLSKGITEDRQGMMIIQNEGILKLIRGIS